MSNSVNYLLSLFDALPEPDKQAVALEILRRSPLGETDVPLAELDALADELFVRMDAEEVARADG